MPETYENHHDEKLHVVSPIQWIIIILLGGGMLFGWYAGCGSNHFGVTEQLPPDPTISNTK